MIAIMNKIKFAIPAICICFLSACSVAQKLPAKKDVLNTVTLANKYFMDKWPDAGKEIFVPSRNRSWPSHIWTRAVYYEGLMALYIIDINRPIMIMRLTGAPNINGI
jgi:hypothetical protein